MKIFLSILTAISISFGAFALVTPTYDDILIPMSDGEFLEADVYIPAGVDSAEVILVQTPYNKNLMQAFSLPFKIINNAALDAQPFIWVIVDWRGFYGSLPAYVQQPDRGQDAYDVCDWIVAQTWHKDRIGTWGPSALGQVQYRLMEKDHPNHTCAVPQVATGEQGYDQYFYGGVLEKARLDQLDALGYGLSPLVMSNVYDNWIWQGAASTTWYADDIKIPTLQQGGWYDHQIDHMMTFYTGSRNQADVSVQDEQWLLVGPWVHGGTGSAYVGSNVQGELTYPNAELISDTMAWDFFEYYLLDSANGWDTTPLVTYYELGEDVWQTSNADDIAATGTNVLYLDQNQQLIAGFGVDSTTFTSDPQNPSPTEGGATLSDQLDQGPYDQTDSIESRSDVISFATGALPFDVSVTGRITLDLYVSSDQPDCDIAVRLIDKYPTGENMLITDGIKRMRFRNNDYTQSGEVFMTPGVVYNVQVDLPFTCYTWKAGHELKIYISGNHAIRWDVNEQDGLEMYQSVPGNVADITIHHNATYPSNIILPGNNPSLGVEANVDFTEFSLYPNPAHQDLNIQTTEQIKSYEIFDMTGKLVKQGIYNGVSISLIDLDPAVYIFKAETISGKLLEQKFSKL